LWNLRFIESTLCFPQAVKVAKRIPDYQPMCIFWRLQGGTAEFYMEDDPEATEVMLDDYAEYFREFGHYWWYNGGLSSQERKEVAQGGVVRVENLVQLGGVLMYYESGFRRLPYHPFNAELFVDILPWHSDLAYRAPEGTLASTNSSQRPVLSLDSQ
jgi:hypothetical protein